MLFQTENHTAQRLHLEQDAAALQALLEACADFNLLIEGEPPGPDAAQVLFSETPPGRSADDKYVIGLYDGARSLFGVVDVVRDYPAGGEWFIGLLLIHPAQRGQGTGAEIVRALEAWAIRSGARCLELGVVEANTPGGRFWEQVGFVQVRTSEMRQFGQKEHRVIYMQRDLE